jgi:hypothetical protein
VDEFMNNNVGTSYCFVFNIAYDVLYVVGVRDDNLTHIQWVLAKIITTSRIQICILGMSNYPQK